MFPGEKSFTVGRIPSYSDAKEKVQVDLKDYKHAKMISRKHLRFIYDQETGKFHVQVLGRNGAVVSTAKCSKGDTVELRKKQTAIRIGRADFVFTINI